jgi:phosphohistidine phosphatase
MAATTRTLVVMRHAKAEQAGPTDFERPLAERGHRDAAAAGSWLAGQGVVPDHALVSAALRTTETWDHVSRGAGWTLAPELDRGLYAADAETALDVVRLLDDAVTTAVVVGHNPTMHSLAAMLDDGEGDVAAANELTVGTFPTSAVAVLAVTVPWSELAVGRASVTAYHVGRG